MRKKKWINYNALLRSLHNDQTRPESGLPEDCIDTGNTASKPFSDSDKVSLATRQKSSKLSDPKNGYAYSTKENIIHDRTCWYVSKIKDEDFEMSRSLIPGMDMCTACRRKAWIRVGMGDDTKYIEAYARFFKETYVSNELLYSIFVENALKVKMLDSNHMRFDVHGEKWIIERVGKMVRIFHNNYYITDNGTRIRQEEFHVQREKPLVTSVAIERMISYSWEIAHLDESEQNNEISDTD